MDSYINITVDNMPDSWSKSIINEISSLYGNKIAQGTNIEGIKLSNKKTCNIQGKLKNKDAYLNNIYLTCNAMTDPSNPISVNKTVDISQTVSISIDDSTEISKSLGVTCDLGVAGDLFSLSVGGEYNVTTTVGKTITHSKEKTISTSSGIAYDISDDMPVYEVWFNILSELEDGNAEYIYTPLSLTITGQYVDKIDIKKVISNIGKLTYSTDIKLNQLIKTVVVISCDKPKNLLSLCLKKLNITLDK